MVATAQRPGGRNCEEANVSPCSSRPNDHVFGGHSRIGASGFLPSSTSGRVASARSRFDSATTRGKFNADRDLFTELSSESGSQSSAVLTPSSQVTLAVQEKLGKWVSGAEIVNGRTSQQPLAPGEPQGSSCLLEGSLLAPARRRRGASLDVSAYQTSATDSNRERRKEGRSSSLSGPQDAALSSATARRGPWSAKVNSQDSLTERAQSTYSYTGGPEAVARDPAGGEGKSRDSESPDAKLSILPAIVSALRVVTGPSDVPSVLRSFPRSELSTKLLAAVLKQLRRNWRVVLGVYEWMQREAFDLTVHVYTLVLGSAGNVGQWGVVDRVLRDMARAGVKKDAFVYNTLILCNSNGGRHEEALEWYREMGAHNIQGNQVLYTTVIKMLTKAQHHEEAAELSDELRRRGGFTPDAMTLCTLITAYSQAERLDSALELFGRMRQQPKAGWDVVVWNAAVSAFARAGMPGEAEALVHEMEEVWWETQGLGAEAVHVDTWRRNLLGEERSSGSRWGARGGVEDLQGENQGLGSGAFRGALGREAQSSGGSSFGKGMRHVDRQSVQGDGNLEPSTVREVENCVDLAGVDPLSGQAAGSNGTKEKGRSSGLDESSIGTAPTLLDDTMQSDVESSQPLIEETQAMNGNTQGTSVWDAEGNGLALDVRLRRSARTHKNRQGMQQSSQLPSQQIEESLTTGPAWSQPSKELVGRGQEGTLGTQSLETRGGGADASAGEQRSPGERKDAGSTVGREVQKGKGSWASRKLPFGPTSHAYNALIHAYCLAGEAEKAEETKERMLLHGFLPTPVTYNTLLSLYARWPASRTAEAVEKAEALVHEMQTSGRGSLDVYSFCTLIGLYNRGGMPERATRTYQSMLLLGLKPDLHIYSAMIALYGRRGLPEEAAVLYEKVKAQGLSPDATILTSMLGVYQKLGRVDDAAAVAAAIEDLGQGIDAIVSSAVISFFSKAGRLGDAVRVFEAARREFGRPRPRNLRGAAPRPSVEPPVEASSETLLGASVEGPRALAVRSASGQGEEDVQRPSRRPVGRDSVGPTPDRRGMTLGRRKGRKREPVDAVLLSAMIDAYGKAGVVDKAEALFQELQALEAPGYKNLVAYTSMISLLGKHGRVEEAQDLFSQLRAAGVLLDSLVFNAMLDALAKGGQQEPAQRLFHEMMQAGPTPTVYTYTILIDMYGKDGNLMEASKAFGHMLQRGLRPSVVTYNSLIHMFAQAGMHNDAHALYQRMWEEDGVRPNSVTYNIMLHMHADAGNPWDAIRVFREMERVNCEPDAAVLLLVAKMYGKIGQFSRMNDLKSRPGAQVFGRATPTLE